MPGVDAWLAARGGAGLPPGGLFIDGAADHGAAFLAAMPGCAASVSVRPRRGRRAPGWFFASVSLPVKGGVLVRGSVSVGLVAGGAGAGAGDGDKKDGLVDRRRAREDMVETKWKAATAVVVEEERRTRAGAGAMNTTKHLWAGAVAAMVSRRHRRLQRLNIRIGVSRGGGGFHRRRRVPGAAAGSIGGGGFQGRRRVSRGGGIGGVSRGGGGFHRRRLQRRRRVPGAAAAVSRGRRRPPARGGGGGHQGWRRFPAVSRGGGGGLQAGGNSGVQGRWPSSSSGGFFLAPWIPARSPQGQQDD